MRDRREDVGPGVIDFVYATLGLDDAWSVREPRGVTWWGHRLAQRVWAEAARDTTSGATRERIARPGVGTGEPCECFSEVTPC